MFACNGMIELVQQIRDVARRASGQIERVIEYVFACWPLQ
jgi:hypothetical protein